MNSRTTNATITHAYYSYRNVIMYAFKGNHDAAATVCLSERYNNIRRFMCATEIVRGRIYLYKFYFIFSACFPRRSERRLTFSRTIPRVASPLSGGRLSRRAIVIYVIYGFAGRRRRQSSARSATPYKKKKKNARRNKTERTLLQITCVRVLSILRARTRTKTHSTTLWRFNYDRKRGRIRVVRKNRYPRERFLR